LDEEATAGKNQGFGKTIEIEVGAREPGDAEAVGGKPNALKTL
jgi:hypothetical protein